MSTMPFQILGIWLRGVLALVLLGAGISLLRQWYTHRYIDVIEPGPVTVLPRETPSQRTAAPEQEAPPERVRRVPWQFGLNWETAYLLGGLALLAWSLAGRWLGPTLWRRRGEDDPQPLTASEVRRLQGPDGTELHVELYGPDDGLPVILTHGWSLDGDEWYYTKRDLARRHRLIVWDLPGLGRSTRPADNDWSLEKLAANLDTVLELAGDRPSVLVGHSIGGMIALTHCRLFPEAWGRRVGGLVLVHSTYTNPVRTTAWAKLHTALQKPVLEPLCHLMIWLAPIVWGLNWLSYLNGSAHRSTERSSFSGRESREQLNFLARYTVKAWPAVLARGFLAMFRYDATSTLPRISVPTLVVAGDQDKTCTPEASAEMSQAIPGASLVTLQPARHGGHFEHHGPFNRAVQQFIETHAQAPAHTLA